MATKDIISEQAITVAEVKQILTDISKTKAANEEEMDYVQKKSLSHAENTAKVSLKDAQAMQEEFTALELDPEKAIEIINVMPASRDELRTIFSKERKQPETDVLDKILDVVLKYK